MSFNSTHHTPNIDFKHRKVPADWKTGFESRLTYKLHLPYQEFIGVSGGFEDITDSSCEYRLVRLSNNLTAVCVHNPDAKQAAAALSVNVGHMATPPELPGLAHLLEHVLFMSSAKYPDEDEYRAYLSGFSGKANAYTDNANTCFHFDVSNSGLEGALDRFSRFFIDPLINADSVHRELHAVDSEHTLYTRMDSWRQYIMFKAITDQTHPYAIYGNGNTGTLKESADKLGLDLHQELVNFYQKFYSADIMNLVIYGNHGLDQLTEWAVSMFSSIESKGVTKPLLPTHHPLSSNHLGKIVHFESISNDCYIKLVFAFPETKSQYASGAELYLCSLLSRQGKGSLLQFLKHQGWANGIDAGIENSIYDKFNFLHIRLYATHDGITHYEEIVRAVFVYLRVVTKQGLKEWYFDELSCIKLFDFNTRTADDIVNWICELAEHCHNEYIEPARILSQAQVLDKYNQSFISEFIGYINPHNYVLLIGAQTHDKVKCTSEETHFGIKFHLDNLPHALRGALENSIACTDQFEFPLPNVHLPSALRARFTQSTAAFSNCFPTRSKLTPRIIRSTNKWYSTRHGFGISSRGSIMSKIDIPDMNKSPRSAALHDLYIMYAELIISEKFYDAMCFGIEINISKQESSIIITVNGFQNTKTTLLCAIIDRLKAQLTVDRRLFEISLFELGHKYDIARLDSPQKIAKGNFHSINNKHIWDTETLTQAMTSLTPSDLQTVCACIFNTSHTKMTFYGRMQKRDVIEAMRTTTVSKTSLVIPTFTRSNNSVSDIPPGHYIQTTTAPDKDQQSSAVIVNIYCGQLSNAHDTVAGTVLFNLVNSAYFSQLRTAEHLGYSVGAENISFGVGRSILSFSVEGEPNPVYATMRIDRFIAEFRQVLVSYDERKLASQIETQISACQGLPWSVLRKNTGGFWPRAKHAVFNFIATDEKIRALRRLSRDDLVAYWDKYINPKTAAARNYTRIDCQVWSFRILQPTAEQLCRYKSGIIALYGCLNQNGIYGISMSNLETTVAHASANDNVDSLLAKLAQTIKHRADAAQLARVVSSDQNSRVKTALGMAIDERKEAAALAYLSAENKLLAASIGVQQTPNGAWLVRNIKKFKSVQAVLQPKHIALQVSCYCKEFCK